jgi:hypothetical protein
MGINPKPIDLTPKERRRQNVYKFFSALCDRFVELESFTEFLVWLSLEFSPDVIFLCERPCRLEGRVEGKKQTYRPDLFVRAKGDGAPIEHLGETKKREDCVEVEPDVWQPKRWPVLQSLVDETGLPLRLYTDFDFVEQRVAVDNWREALPYVADEAQRPRHELRELVLEHYQRMGQLPLGEVSASIAGWERSEVDAATLWWVHQGRLQFDWNDRPLGRDSLFTLAPESADWRRA